MTLYFYSALIQESQNNRYHFTPYGMLRIVGNPILCEGKHGTEKCMNLTGSGRSSLSAIIFIKWLLGMELLAVVVLVLPGINLIFFIAACTGRHFVFVLKTVLITQGCFSYC